MAENRPLLRSDLLRIARESHVPPEVIEKDYALSYLLAGLAGVQELGELCFKGGTALKKIYFGDYRFSEDLDFTAIEAPRSKDLEAAMDRARSAAERLLQERGRFQVEFDRPPEQEPHPTGQESFRFRFAFPWQPRPMVRVKVEITFDEPVLLEAPVRPLLHGYEALGENLTAEIKTYAIEEIVAEKLRALRQTQRRLEERGWNRPRARDYYDLWRLLTDYRVLVDTAVVTGILKQKFAVRGVGFAGPSDFFSDQLVSEARSTWHSNLGIFVADLPPVDEVLARLRLAVEKLING